MFRANAVYEGTYLLGTSIARPLISKRQIEIAKEVGADAVCHGTLIWHIICNSCMGTYGRLD
jgi:argininosuccinate synthase